MRGFIYRQCEKTTPPATPLHLVGGRGWYLWWYDNGWFTRRAVHWTNFEVKKCPDVEAHYEKRIWEQCKKSRINHHVYHSRLLLGLVRPGLWSASPVLTGSLRPVTTVSATKNVTPMDLTQIWGLTCPIVIGADRRLLSSSGAVGALLPCYRTGGIYRRNFGTR